MAAARCSSWPSLKQIGEAWHLGLMGWNNLGIFVIMMPKTLCLQAAVEEGIVIGGGCTLLKLAQKVDAIKASFTNEEQRIGAEIVRRVP